MASGGQSNRSQFQIGKASLRSRPLYRRSRAQSRGPNPVRIVIPSKSAAADAPRGAQALPLSPLATGHSPVATGFAYTTHPVSRILSMFLKTKGIRISTGHRMPRRSFVTNHELQLPNHCFSNRYTVRIEIAVTPTKQTSLVLSNRYNGTPPWESDDLVTPAPICISTRYTLANWTRRKPFPVSNMIFSTRYKKPPPGGVLLYKQNALFRHQRPCGRKARQFRPTHPGL